MKNPDLNEFFSFKFIQPQQSKLNYVNNKHILIKEPNHVDIPNWKISSPYF